MLNTKQEITEWLNKYKIKNYTINDDLTVDVNGAVYLNSKELTDIPIQFGNVSGSFYCNDNKLISLKGCPHEVGGNFWCDNNQLTSLKYLPNKIPGEFYYHDNKLENKLIYSMSLEDIKKYNIAEELSNKLNNQIKNKETQKKIKI